MSTSAPQLRGIAIITDTRCIAAKTREFQFRAKLYCVATVQSTFGMILMQLLTRLLMHPHPLGVNTASKYQWIVPLWLCVLFFQQHCSQAQHKGRA